MSPEHSIGGSIEAAVFITMEEGVHDGDNTDRTEEVSIAELSPGFRGLMIYLIDLWLYHSTRNFLSLQKGRLLLEVKGQLGRV